MKLRAAAIGLLGIAASGANAKQGSLRDQNERVLVTCGDKDLIEVDITTDAYPNETSWELFTTCTGSEVLLMANSGDEYTKEEAQPTDETCVIPDKYLFRIKDSYGDGIYYPGGYEIKLNGKPVVTETFYDSSEKEDEFGECRSSGTPPTPSSFKPTPSSFTPTPSPITPTPPPITNSTHSSFTPTPSPVTPTPPPMTHPTPSSFKPTPSSFTPTPSPVTPTPPMALPTPSSFKPTPSSFTPTPSPVTPTPPMTLPTPSSFKPTLWP